MINGFYIDPVLQQAKKGDVIPVGNFTLVVSRISPREYIHDLGKYSDCQVWVNVYDKNGNIIDKQPNNPLSTASYRNLRGRDYTPLDFIR
jgi:hypothetical protein